jgi:hypothetical protein
MNLFGRYNLPAVGKGSWELDNVFVVYLDDVGSIYTEK